MHYSSAAFVVLSLLTFACSRQPVGVSGSPSDPVPVATGSVEANPEIEEARVLREEETLSQDRPSANPSIPDASDPGPIRREDLGRPTAAPAGVPREASNQSATIENQGSVGQVSLGGDRPSGLGEGSDTPYFTYEKSVCYGDCEAYTFSLRDGGLSSLLVNEGALAAGLYERELYSVDYDHLNSSLDSLRGMELQPLYPVDQEIPTDIPYRRITLPDADGTPREVKVYFGAPPALERFMDRLELLISEQSWQRASKQADDRN